MISHEVLGLLAVLGLLLALYRLMLGPRSGRFAIRRTARRGDTSLDLGWVGVALAIADVSVSADTLGFTVDVGLLAALLVVLLIAMPSFAAIAAAILGIIASTPDIISSAQIAPKSTAGLVGLAVIGSFLACFTGFDHAGPTGRWGVRLLYMWALLQFATWAATAQLPLHSVPTGSIMLIFGGLAMGGAFIPGVMGPLLGAGVVMGQLTFAAIVSPDAGQLATTTTVFCLFAWVAYRAHVAVFGFRTV